MADDAPAPAPADPTWLALQKKIFARYVQQQLKQAGIKQTINDIVADVSDGILLITLTEVMSGKSFGKLPNPPKTRIQQVDNVNAALTFVRSTGVKCDASAEDIIDGKTKFVMGLIFSIIIKYMKLDDDNTESTDVREALNLWLKNKTVGYRDISIDNFNKSFHDGLVFCSLIHKLRPKLIDYESLDKANKLENITLALNTAHKYCNVEKFLEPEDIHQLDDVGMIVYLYDWFMGVSMMQKQDVAARRIGKLADMTKLHDQLKADYNAAADVLVKWVDAKIVELSDRSIDNTMAGVRAKLAKFYEYKTKEKAERIVAHLDLVALFDNLALRLHSNKRAAFAPVHTLEAIDAKFVALENAEAELSKALHTELDRQIKLDRLGKRFRADAQTLESFVGEKATYAANKEAIDSIDMADYHIDHHAIAEQEVAAAKTTRLTNLHKNLEDLKAEKYEFSSELQTVATGVDSKFSALEAALASKRATLTSELENQKNINDTLCKDFNAAVHVFSDFYEVKKKKASEKEGSLEEQLAFVSSILDASADAESKLAAINTVDEKVKARLITVNPYTNVTSQDCAAQWNQFVLFLNKKKDLLVTEIENSKRAGLSEEQIREVNDNFDYFDKDKSEKLEIRELRSCLQSLGEDSTPAGTKAILALYDKDKDSTISKKEFVDFMWKKLMDTNTKEEILEGFKLISLERETVAGDYLSAIVNHLTFKEHHVTYLKAEMKHTDDEYDYNTWTTEVFDR